MRLTILVVLALGFTAYSAFAKGWDADAAAKWDARVAKPAVIELSSP
jgi:hypothetical protein